MEEEVWVWTALWAWTELGGREELDGWAGVSVDEGVGACAVVSAVVGVGMGFCSSAWGAALGATSVPEIWGLD